MTTEHASHPDRAIVLSDAEAHLLLEALAGLMARSCDIQEVTATFRLAQRLEGFTIEDRPGAVRLSVEVQP